MTNIDASLLTNQIDRIETFLEKKEIISEKYNN
jgi:dTDP-4-amino-4,6-dideoxygalactose transaminase